MSVYFPSGSEICDNSIIYPFYYGYYGLHLKNWAIGLLFRKLSLWPVLKMVNITKTKKKKSLLSIVVTLYLGHTQCMG